MADEAIPAHIDIPLPPLGEEAADILDMLATSGELNTAAVSGVDTIYGYADPDDRYQTECIERARQNIKVAIRAAVFGHIFVVQEQSNG